MPKSVFVTAPFGPSLLDHIKNDDCYQDVGPEVCRMESSGSIQLSHVAADENCQTLHDLQGTLQSSLSSMQSAAISNSHSSRWAAAGELDTVDTISPPRKPRQLPSIKLHYENIEQDQQPVRQPTRDGTSTTTTRIRRGHRWRHSQTPNTGIQVLSSSS